MSEKKTVTVKLVRSVIGCKADHRATVKGLGVWKFGSERLLKDTPAIRGMLDRVQHLISFEVVKEEPKVRARRKPYKIRARDAARAAAAKK